MRLRGGRVAGRRLAKFSPIPSKPWHCRRETRFQRGCPHACPQAVWIATRGFDGARRRERCERFAVLDKN